MNRTENTATAARFLVEVRDTDYRSSLGYAGKRDAHEAALAAFRNREYPVVRIFAAGGPAPTRRNPPLAVYARDERDGSIVARRPAGDVVGAYTAR